MKKIAFFFVIILIVLYVAGQTHPDQQGVDDSAGLLKIQRIIEIGGRRVMSWLTVSPAEVTAVVDDIFSAAAEVTRNKDDEVTLFLINGSAITGVLVSHEDGVYSLQWQGGVVTFSDSEVGHVERGSAISSGDIIMPTVVESTPTWAYQHDCVILLTNGEILDNGIGGVRPDMLTLRQELEGGGAIEQDLSRARLESLLFKPVENDESARIRAALKQRHPAMNFYEDGNITIVTDSYHTWVKKYKNTLREVQKEIYLAFFPLFQTRTQSVQNFVVIFDSVDEYIEHAITDGVPGWLAPGYYDPEQHVLYTFNMLGDTMEAYIRDVVERAYGQPIDQWVENAKRSTGGEHDLAIEGMAEEYKNKFSRYFEWWRGSLRRMTTMIVRHEFAHETFNNWGIQMVSMSKGKDDAQLKKKKTLSGPDDGKGKRQLLMELISLRSKDPVPELQAANSWLTEGIATYCETRPLGAQNDERLFTMQRAYAQGLTMPLEQLTVYKIGSFPGVYHDVMLEAYSHSWALVSFFMDTYPTEFLSYMDRVATNVPRGNQDVEWLVEAIGKDVRVIEQELAVYIGRFPQLADPYLAMLDRRKKLWDDIVYFT